MKGRRVPDMEGMSELGDYVVVYGEGGEISSLWMNLPVEGGHWARIPAVGNPEPGPKWKITEDEDGVVTVAPAIYLSTAYFRWYGIYISTAYFCWYGHLRDGVFIRGYLQNPANNY